jgi:Sodium/calcium exchanger protein
MHWPDFHEIGLAGNLAAFGLASALVWLAGDRLARCSQVIADCTKLGQAFIGTVLLGVTVSLPEMTLAAVAAALGNAALAVNSPLGGIAITMVVLAITDLAVGEEPLSINVQHPVVLLQGALVIVMLTVAAAGMTAGDLPLPGLEVAGAWTTVFRRARTYDARAPEIVLGPRRVVRIGSRSGLDLFLGHPVHPLPLGQVAWLTPRRASLGTPCAHLPSPFVG